MAKLTINALNNTVMVQDPNPVTGKVVIEANVGTLATAEVDFDQLQRMMPKLVALEVAREIDFYVTEGEEDPRGAESELFGLPTISYWEEGSGPITHAAGPTTDHIVHGWGFLGGQEQAQVRLGSATVDDDAILIQAIQPGPAGADLTVSIVHGAGATAFAAGATPNDLVITTDTTANDYETLAGEINAAAGVGAFAAAGVALQARYPGATGVAGLVVAEAQTQLEGGSGPGLTVEVCGVQGTITLVPDRGDSVRFDIDLTAPAGGPAAATAAGQIAVRGGKQLAEINIPIA